MATFGPLALISRSGTPLVLRHCVASDVPAFLDFQRLIAQETTHTLQVAGEKLDPEKVRAAWESSERDPIALRLGFFLPGTQDRIVAQLSFYPERVPPHPWTRHVGRFGMMVLREFWGQGIARRMLEAMEEHARALEITRIEAQVRTQNERGVRLYTRMGYEIEGTRRQAALIDGVPQDEYFIAKHLNADSWSPPTLETERLVLRPFRPSDAPAVLEYASNPNVSAHTLFEPHANIRDSESFILDYALPNYRNGVPEPFAIALKSDPEKAIGSMGCGWSSKKAKVMELAYALAEPHWGQGLTVEAARALLGYVFQSFDVARVQARCKVDNRASARVLEKLGMTFEGTRRAEVFHRGRSWDCHCYSLIRGESQ